MGDRVGNDGVGVEVADCSSGRVPTRVPARCNRSSLKGTHATGAERDTPGERASFRLEGCRSYRALSPVTGDGCRPVRGSRVLRDQHPLLFPGTIGGPKQRGKRKDARGDAPPPPGRDRVGRQCRARPAGGSATGPIQDAMAAGLGFEPRELSLDGFQDRSDRPLRHPAAGYEFNSAPNSPRGLA